MLHRSALVLPVLGVLLMQSPQQRTSVCETSDSAAIVAVRARLAEWVRQTNAGDRVGTNEVWAPNVVGWFPSAGVFSDSAAYVVAGILARESQPRPTKYDLTIDDIVASGTIVVVHDVWTETRQLSETKSVRRQIRGSELWRCQPDGRWRIARWVSAPEPWAARQ